MSGRLTIAIRPDGSVQYIDPAAGQFVEGTASKRRASHVLPAGRVRRAAFILLRWCFGETGAVSDWTRGWKCSWVVQIVNGPHAGPFEKRQAAIDWEVEYIERNVL